MFKSKLAAVLSIILLVLFLAGCGINKNTDSLCGDWAYIHDPDTVVLSLQPSGKASYNGEKFKWKRCDEGISMTSADGGVTIFRCIEEKDRILFYTSAVYTCEGSPSGIVGQWKCENNWSYEFTEKGTFMEDGVLPGHYFVDEDAGTIRLAYNDPLEDTLLYYTISDGCLLVEYPWPMVKTE